VGGASAGSRRRMTSTAHQSPRRFTHRRSPASPRPPGRPGRPSPRRPPNPPTAAEPAARCSAPAVKTATYRGAVGVQTRWHSLVSCDHGDSTTSRFVWTHLPVQVPRDAVQPQRPSHALHRHHAPPCRPICRRRPRRRRRHARAGLRPRRLGATAAAAGVYWVAVPRGLHPLRPNSRAGCAQGAHPLRVSPLRGRPLRAHVLRRTPPCAHSIAQARSAPAASASKARASCNVARQRRTSRRSTRVEECACCWLRRTGVILASLRQRRPESGTHAQRPTAAASY
jgi:hypothetical protein